MKKALQLLHFLHEADQDNVGGYLVIAETPAKEDEAAVVPGQKYFITAYDPVKDQYQIRGQNGAWWLNKSSIAKFTKE